MAVFLSDAWIAQLDRAARELPAPARTITIQQEVTGASSACYHMVLGPIDCRVKNGRAADADLFMSVDRRTAVQLARGAENAQRALADGRLKIRGRLDILAELGGYLVGLGDMFVEVRAATEYPDE